MASATYTLEENAESGPCRGVVLYPDEGARHRALQFSEKIVKRFEDQIYFDFRWWKLKFLRDSILMGQAIQEASAAQILLFSYRSGLSLTDEVKAFFELWIDQRKKGPCAIVGLGDPTDQAGTVDRSMVDYLQRIADRSNSDLIAGSRPEWQSEMAQISCRANHLTPTLENILQHTPALDPVAPALARNAAPSPSLNQ